MWKTCLVGSLRETLPTTLDDIPPLTRKIRSVLFKAQPAQEPMPRLYLHFVSREILLLRISRGPWHAAFRQQPPEETLVSPTVCSHACAALTRTRLLQTCATQLRLS